MTYCTRYGDSLDIICMYKVDDISLRTQLSGYGVYRSNNHDLVTLLSL